MNTRQKYEAIKALIEQEPITVFPRHNEDDTWSAIWTCRCGNIGDDVFVWTCSCTDMSAEEAIDGCWQLIESLEDKQYIIVNNMCVRWNGFMWKSVDRK
jgi:hypothetical protein